MVSPCEKYCQHHHIADNWLERDSETNMTECLKQEIPPDQAESTHGSNSWITLSNLRTAKRRVEKAAKTKQKTEDSYFDGKEP